MSDRSMVRMKPSAMFGRAAITPEHGPLGCFFAEETAWQVWHCHRVSRNLVGWCGGTPRYPEASFVLFSTAAIAFTTSGIFVVIGTGQEVSLYCIYCVSTKHIIVKCTLKFRIIPSAPGLHRVSGLLNPDMTLYWLKGWSALPALFELRLQRI